MAKIKLTVDVVSFCMIEERLHTLLIKRKFEPFKDFWAIPGGFVNEGEDLQSAALRELREETGVKDIYIEQLFTFGDPGRDPRGRVVTVAYLALLPSSPTPHEGSDALDAKWIPVKQLPSLAFDHRKVLTYAMERLKNKIEYTTAGFGLLPKHFTLSELQQVYEAILNKSIDKRNFRRKISLLDVLEEIKEKKKSGAQRPAQLYRLSDRKFEKLRDKGILFPF